MQLHSGQTITKKQIDIIVLMFLFRGMLFEQLVQALANLSRRPLTKTYRQNTYKDLQKLSKLKVLIREPVRMERTRDFMYLSEEGLEIACQLLDISPGYIGTGYHGDYGDFPYELHRPPKGTMLHHIQLTDTLLEIEKVAAVYPEASIVCRDNRYCSVLYEWEGKSFRFRPDGEILIQGKTYYLEIDRGTEFLEGLKAKFEGYDRYFSWLKNNKRPLPAGVIVVSGSRNPTGFNRRFMTFLNAFMSKMTDWYLEFNMSFGTVEELGRIVNRELNTEYLFQTALRNIMPHYQNTEKGIGAIKYFNEVAGLSCSHGMRFSVTNNTRGVKFFGYERFEYAESRAVSRLLDLYRYMRKQELYKTATFVPVLYHDGGQVMTATFNGFDADNDLNTIFQAPLWLCVKDERPLWTTSKGEQLNAPNPLL